MNLLVAGATGRTGRLVCELARTRGHVVTALARESTMAPVLTNHDALISCLGQRSGGNPNLLRDAARAAIAAGVRRYLVISQGILFPEKSPIFVLLRAILASQVKDSAAMESVVRASDVDWTIARPPRLTDGAAARGYRAVRDARPKGGWSMHRIDLARFLVDEVERNEHDHEIVGLASA